MILTVRDLSREQMRQLKCHYMMQLVNEGAFAEVVGRDYDEPSYADFENAGEIVPDDVIFRNYDGICFVEEDFFN